MQTGVAIERLLPDDLRGAGQGDPPEATVESGDGSFELGRRVSANRTRGSVVMKIPLRFSPLFFQRFVMEVELGLEPLILMHDTWQI